MFTAQDLNVLSQSLQKNKMLFKLDLHCFQFNKEGFNYLCSGLVSLTALKELNLSCYKRGGLTVLLRKERVFFDIRLLINALRNNKTLELLDLSGYAIK